MSRTTCLLFILLYLVCFKSFICNIYITVACTNNPISRLNLNKAITRWLNLHFFVLIYPEIFKCIVAPWLISILKRRNRQVIPLQIFNVNVQQKKRKRGIVYIGIACEGEYVSLHQFGSFVIYCVQHFCVYLSKCINIFMIFSVTFSCSGRIRWLLRCDDYSCVNLRLIPELKSSSLNRIPLLVIWNYNMKFSIFYMQIGHYLCCFQCLNWANATSKQYDQNVWKDVRS